MSPGTVGHLFNLMHPPPFCSGRVISTQLKTKHAETADEEQQFIAIPGQSWILISWCSELQLCSEGFPFGVVASDDETSFQWMITLLLY